MTMNRPNVQATASLSLISVGLLCVFGCALIPPKPAWKVAPPPPKENAITAADDLHRASLANGLKVIVLEDHRLPRISMGVTLRRGAGSVDPTFAGVAAIAMEVMQRGAGDRDALALAKVIEDVGASMSASAGWDSTTVSLSGLSEDRAVLFEILEDVLFRPRFEEMEFDKTRAEQQASIVAAQDDPATLVGWHALRTLYPGHRYGLPPAGTDETISKIDVAAARAYWTDRFVAKNVVFWAVGDLSAETLIAEVERVFAALPEGPVISDTPPTPVQTPASRRVVVVDKQDLAQARIVVAHEGIARNEPTRIAIDLMNNALGGSGFSSRLMKTIRSDRGLTYGVRSGFSLRSQPGPFSVSTFTRVAKVREVVDLILGELVAIQGERPIAEEELAKFVSYNVGSFGLSLETSNAVLSSLVDLEIHGLAEDALDTYRRRVREVALEDIIRAAEVRLHPERAAIIVMGPADLLVPELDSLLANPADIEIREP